MSVVINAVAVNRSATPEQFATLFAMVARYLGVPARLVTGFRLPARSDAGLTPAGGYLISNRQAWTWVEIPVAGLGWGYSHYTNRTLLRIDHILAGPGWTCRRCWVGPDVNSEHRPVIADLVWAGKRD